MPESLNPVSGRSIATRRLGTTYTRRAMPCDVCGIPAHYRDMWNDGKARCRACDQIKLKEVRDGR